MARAAIRGLVYSAPWSRFYVAGGVALLASVCDTARSLEPSELCNQSRYATRLSNRLSPTPEREEAQR